MQATPRQGGAASYGMKDWLTENKKNITLFIIFFLVSTISFALGYLSAKENSRADIIIEKVERPGLDL